MSTHAISMKHAPFTRKTFSHTAGVAAPAVSSRNHRAPKWRSGPADECSRCHTRYRLTPLPALHPYTRRLACSQLPENTPRAPRRADPPAVHAEQVTPGAQRSHVVVFIATPCRSKAQV